MKITISEKRWGKNELLQTTEETGKELANFREIKKKQGRQGDSQHLGLGGKQLHECLRGKWNCGLESLIVSSQSTLGDDEKLCSRKQCPWSQMTWVSTSHSAIYYVFISNSVSLSLSSLTYKMVATILPTQIGSLQAWGDFSRCYPTLPNLVFQEENKRRFMEIPRWRSSHRDLFQAQQDLLKHRKDLQTCLI